MGAKYGTKRVSDEDEIFPAVALQHLAYSFEKCLPFQRLAAGDPRGYVEDLGRDGLLLPAAMNAETTYMPTARLQCREGRE